MEDIFNTWMPYAKIPYTLDGAHCKNDKWVVTEKVHGAHLSLLTNGSMFKIAKRTKILTADEPFFQYQRIQEELHLNSIRLWNILYETDPTILFIDIHGELFGGIYPQNDIPGIQPIQTGIYYSPDIHFIAYDIAVYYINTTHPIYIPFLEMNQMCKDAGFLTLSPLFVGSKQKALHFSPTFISTIPAFFHLPIINGNYAEGIVVRSIADHILIKIKSKEFAEIDDNISFSGDIFDLGCILGRMNKNRIDSARSKLGSNVQSDDLFNEVMEDVFSELCAENHKYVSFISSLNETDLISIKDYIMRCISKT